MYILECVRNCSVFHTYVSKCIFSKKMSLIIKIKLKKVNLDPRRNNSIHRGVKEPCPRCQISDKTIFLICPKKIQRDYTLCGPFKSIATLDFKIARFNRLQLRLN